jgi:hypothetical protein
MEEEKNPVQAASMARAAIHLLHPRQLHDSLALAPQPSLRIALVAGLQASLAVFAALVLTLASPWPELVGFPALGALAALFGRFAPLPRRRRMVAAAALLLLAAVLPLLAVLPEPVPVDDGRWVFNCRAWRGPVWLLADGSILRMTTAAMGGGGARGGGGGGRGGPPPPATGVSCSGPSAACRIGGNGARSSMSAA